jgi:hypothetical protein
MGTYAVQLCGEVLDAAEYPPPVDKSTFAAAMPGFLQRMQAHAPASSSALSRSAGSASWLDWRAPACSVELFETTASGRPRPDLGHV